MFSQQYPSQHYERPEANWGGDCWKAQPQYDPKVTQKLHHVDKLSVSLSDSAIKAKDKTLLAETAGQKQAALGVGPKPGGWQELNEWTTPRGRLFPWHNVVATLPSPPKSWLLPHPPSLFPWLFQQSPNRDEAASPPPPPPQSVTHLVTTGSGNLGNHEKGVLIQDYVVCSQQHTQHL